MARKRLTIKVIDDILNDLDKQLKEYDKRKFNKLVMAIDKHRKKYEAEEEYINRLRKDTSPSS